MGLHRLAVPTYFGGLPSGYDYINNATSGTPALADGAAASGTNAGTYFVGFADAGTSADANRPAKALAQNTDYLDDLLHRDIALPVRTNDSTVTGGLPLTTLTLTGPGVFMGLAGAQLKDLFHVTDANDDDIESVTTKVAVSAAVDAGSVAVGGGFSAGNVTLTFSPGIPAGVTWHLYYAQRTNLATLPADSLTSTHIRNLTEVDYQVEELFRQLHGGGAPWNGSWTATVYDLATRGLDGLYRNSTTGGGATNTAGAGAIITRDGLSPASVGAQSTRTYVDTFQQLWKATSNEVGAAATGPLGSGGFLFQGHAWTLLGSNTAAVPTPSLYSFASFTKRAEPIVTGSPTVGQGYATKIAPGCGATFTNLGGGYFSVTLAAGNYFYTSWNGGANVETAVATGDDVLICNVGGKEFALVICNLTATANVADLASLDGFTVPDLTTGATGTVTWASPRFKVGESGASAKNALEGFSAAIVHDGRMLVVPQRPPLTSDVTDTTGPFKTYFDPVTAYFGGVNPPPGAFSATPSTALAWGAFKADLSGGIGTGGFWQTNGQLLADGSFAVTGGTSSGQISSKNFYSANYANSISSHATSSGGSTQSIVFSTEEDSVVPIQSTAKYQVLAWRYFSGTTTVTSVLLPLNAGIGDKFYLILCGVDGTVALGSNVAAACNRSGTDGSSGRTWRVVVLNGASITTTGGAGAVDIFEFTCVYASDTNSWDQCATYLVTNHTGSSGGNHDAIGSY